MLENLNQPKHFSKRGFNTMSGLQRCWEGWRRKRGRSSYLGCCHSWAREPKGQVCAAEFAISGTKMSGLKPRCPLAPATVAISSTTAPGGRARSQGYGVPPFLLPSTLHWQILTRSQLAGSNGGCSPVGVEVSTAHFLRRYSR